MPYTETALQNLEFYQDMIREDEAKYLKRIQENIESGNVDDGILRDNNGNIIKRTVICPNSTPALNDRIWDKDKSI